MKFYKRVMILAVLIAIPVIVWILMEPLSARFQNLSTTTTSLGQLSALAGIILLSLNFILNSRIKILDKIFSGINNSYIAHHAVGTVAFLLLLFHPLLLSIKFLVFSLQDAINFLVPGSQLPTLFGFLAISVMIVLLFLTFMVKLKYKTWKFTHQFLGLALILAGIHVLLITSDISRNLFLKIYVLFFVVVGTGFYLYRTPFSRYFVKKYSYEVSDVKQPAPNLTEIILNPTNPNKKLSEKPGQFMFISFYGKDGKISREQHPFTLSSSPYEYRLRIEVKSLGDYTSNIKELKPGTKALIEGPFGSFIPQFEKEQIWISGGIGITPFLSMARSLNSKPDKEKISRIDFYYSFKDKNEDIFYGELKKISENNKALNLFPRYTNIEGNLNAEIIEKTSGSFKEKEIFICGPRGMMEDLKKQLKKKGVPKEKIHSDEFSFLD